MKKNAINLARQQMYTTILWAQKKTRKKNKQINKRRVAKRTARI